MPSTQTSRKTKSTFALSASTLKNPTADSYASVARITN